MITTTQKASASALAPRSSLLAPRAAFTLIELLVVITIIGILASLIVAAAMMATRKAAETDIKAEINQIDTALMEYKNKTTSFPPNCQTDDTTVATPEAAADPLDETAILNDIKRHLYQAFPRHQEPPALIAGLVGLAADTGGAPTGRQGLQEGMSAGEAIVFWLGGFSSDPKFPISGDGGPSYAVINPAKSINITAAERRKADPIESRKWVFPFDVGRLAPRATDGYFDESDNRYIEYTIAINGQSQTRRINFWQYKPKKSEQPFLYFDTSRHPALVLSTSGAVSGPFDPPASSTTHVHAFKKVSEITGTNVPRITFANPDKFQVLHAGLDDEWDVDAFERMSVHDIGTNIPDDYLLFPNGPFVGEIADTVVNFTTGTRIEDAQP